MKFYLIRLLNGKPSKHDFWLGFTNIDSYNDSYNDSFTVCDKISDIFEIDNDATALQIHIHENGENILKHDGMNIIYTLNGYEVDSDIFYTIRKFGLYNILLHKKKLKFDIWQIY